MEVYLPTWPLEHHAGSGIKGLPATPGQGVEAKAHLSIFTGTWGLEEAGIGWALTE